MKKFFSLTALLFLIFPSIGSGKPMDEPMLPASKEGACNYGSVVIAEYRGYSNNPSSGSIGYFDPPLTSFQIKEHVHGPAVPTPIPLLYDFHDGSACLEPPTWKFDASVLPPKGSRGLLFGKPNGRGQYMTYRGDYGRVPVGKKAQELLSECNAGW
jgi:hypothetical protein